jgi:hypothetical protein
MKPLPKYLLYLISKNISMKILFLKFIFYLCALEKGFIRGAKKLFNFCNSITKIDFILLNVNMTENKLKSSKCIMNNN